MPYIIKHKITKAYLNEWFKQEKVGHWVESMDNAKTFNLRAINEFKDYMDKQIEVIKVKAVKKSECI
jgi:hypothetical protein